MKRLSIGQIVCDLVIVAFFVGVVLVFQFSAVPHKRGFYCDDESIRYPYKSQTIDATGLLVVGILIPMLLILLTEVFRVFVWERNNEHLYKNDYFLSDWNVHRLFVRLYIFIGFFFIGVCINQLMIDVAKYSIGRLRPNFIEICKPSVGYESCEGISGYITDFVCTGTTTHSIKDARLSFYSGHSSLCFYSAWFLALYLQARIYRPLVSRLVLPMIQVLLFVGASYVTFTRVSDYRHHWSDVLLGALMGSIIGIVNAIIFTEVFKRKELPDNVDSLSLPTSTQQ